MQYGKIIQLKLNYILNENKIGGHLSINEAIANIEKAVCKKLTSDEFIKAIFAEEVNIMSNIDQQSKFIELHVTVETDSDQVDEDIVKNFLDRHFDTNVNDKVPTWEEIYGYERVNENVFDYIAYLTTYEVEVF